MWYVWSSGEDHTGLWWGNVQEREYLENLHLCGVIVLWVLGTNCWKCAGERIFGKRTLVWGDHIVDLRNKLLEMCDRT